LRRLLLVELGRCAGWQSSDRNGAGRRIERESKLSREDIVEGIVLASGA
jgi:hypothetical protein